ncbi:MAG: asparagine synthase-related protein, partial [Kiritimatiellaeota bacterium]|nr:asparagine synthase-related protein [Kiritimatiellota bacterium]
IKLNDKDRYWRWCSYINEETAESFIKHSIDKNDYYERKEKITQYINRADGLNDVLYSDMHLVLQNDMLTKVDLMSMANSLEVRVPFLDYELVNYVFSLPSEFKIDTTSRKKILKDAFRKYLPEELYTRSKHGFEVPLLKWFRTELKSMILDDLLKDEFIIQQDIFNLAEIQKLKKRLFSVNPGDVHAQIWALIVFQYWWKKYVNN